MTLSGCVSFPQECRARKNFSSLYSIVSALQSNPIHRLRRTWQEADRSVGSPPVICRPAASHVVVLIVNLSPCREALRRYEDLAEIFSDKDNYSHSRELLKEVS